MLRLRHLFSVAALALLAVVLTGCHDGYSTYSLNYRSQPHFDSYCEPAPVYCQPPRHRHRHWH